MVAYYLMMLTMALFYLLLNRVIITYKGNCINNVAFLSVAWVLLSLLEGFRSFSVGTDTSAYVSLFKHPRSSLEGGFQLLISLVHKFSNNPTIFLLVCAFITNGLVLLAIYRMSDNVFLSVYFYVALYYYFISYNALRQYLAVAVLLNAFWYAKQKICKDGSLDVTPSPRLNTNFLREKGLRLDGSIEKLDCGMTIYPAEYFAPKDFKTGQVVLTDKTYSIHHYDASWMEPEDKQVLRIKWAMEKYKGVGKIVTYTSTKLLGLKRHLRMQGLQGTIQYIRDKR